MSAILVRAKIATEIKTLSTREQWPDSAVSHSVNCMWSVVGLKSKQIMKNKRSLGNLQ